MIILCDNCAPNEVFRYKLLQRKSFEVLDYGKLVGNFFSDLNYDSLYDSLQHKYMNRFIS